MTKKNLTEYDYYGLGSAYRERSRIAVNSEDLAARQYAAGEALQAYKDSADRLLKSQGYGRDTFLELDNCDVLSCYYHLACLVSEQGIDKSGQSADLWTRTVTLHQSARYFIDFIWTLSLYQLPGLESHLFILSKILPNGYHDRFDLTCLTDEVPVSPAKEYVNTILADLSKKRTSTRSSNKGSGGGDGGHGHGADETSRSGDPRKLLDYANRAIWELMDIVEELSLYMCTVAKGLRTEEDLGQAFIQLSEVPCPPPMLGHNEPQLEPNDAHMAIPQAQVQYPPDQNQAHYMGQYPPVPQQQQFGQAHTRQGTQQMMPQHVNEQTQSPPVQTSPAPGNFDENHMNDTDFSFVSYYNQNIL